MEKQQKGPWWSDALDHLRLRGRLCAGEKMLALKAPVQSVHGRLEFATADRRTTVRSLIEGAAD